MARKKRKAWKKIKKKDGYSSDLERRFHKYLKNLGIDADYEKHKISYKIEDKCCQHCGKMNFLTKFYTPDFVYDPNSKRRLDRTTKELKGKVIIETKGRFTQRDRNKMLWVKEQHPELDIRIVLMDDRVIDGRKKGRRDGEKGLQRKGYRHSDWCIDNEYTYYIGENPPKKWFN